MNSIIPNETVQASALNLPVTAHNFPFRLGTSSYIIPADIEPNVRLLAPLMDDIEIVLFESDEFSNMPTSDVIETLNHLQQTYNNTYTIHLPLDCNLGAPDLSERESSVGKCLRAFDLTSPLEPYAYVIHLHGEKRGNRPAENISKWQERCKQSIKNMLKHGVPPEKMVVETLDYPFELVQPIVEALGLSVCIDVGHLMLAERDPVDAILSNRERCRVVHLHGVRDGKDHEDIADTDNQMLKHILNAVTKKQGPKCVVTLEVFSAEILEKCMLKLKELMPWQNIH